MGKFDIRLSMMRERWKLSHSIDSCSNSNSSSITKKKTPETKRKNRVGYLFSLSHRVTDDCSWRCLFRYFHFLYCRKTEIEKSVPLFSPLLLLNLCGSHRLFRLLDDNIILSAASFYFYRNRSSSPKCRENSVVFIFSISYFNHHHFLFSTFFIYLLIYLVWQLCRIECY